MAATLPQPVTGLAEDATKSSLPRLGPMGVTVASYGLRWGTRNHPRQFKDALDLLTHCRSLGAGGIQVGIDDWDAAFTARLREKLEAWDMFLEGQIGLPRDRDDLPRFEARLRSAQKAGATIVRTVMLGGRRYESFSTMESFRQFAERSWNSLVLAESVARKTGIRLAVENHKDWRVDELLGILHRLSSEQVGICVDTGNSISLLEDPMAVVEAYAPWAVTSHFKDMGVEASGDGFLLSEVPLGEGFLDLTAIAERLRKAQPALRFNLEMITRDPLRVPCLSDAYWTTLETLSARPLAHTLGLVRRHPPSQPLPRVSGSTLDQRLDLEEAHVRRCFEYATTRLRMV